MGKIGMLVFVKLIMKKKIKRRYYPNRQFMRLWSDILEQYIWISVSDKGLRMIDKAGSLDRYLLTTPSNRLQSMVGERLRHRLHRNLERKEEIMIQRALNGDKKALPIAYKIIMKEEELETKALQRRNNWLTNKEGIRESKRTKWLREELKRKIELIEQGKLDNQFIPKKQVWEEVANYFEKKPLVIS